MVMVWTKSSEGSIGGNARTTIRTVAAYDITGDFLEFRQTIHLVVVVLILLTKTMRHIFQAILLQTIGVRYLL